MVLDTKLWTPLAAELSAGLLWILEQLPNLVRAEAPPHSDATRTPCSKATEHAARRKSARGTRRAHAAPLCAGATQSG